MKISYKVLKNYIKNIKTAEEIASDLVMHTAEVEDIVLQGKNLEKVFVGLVKTCNKHPDSEKLNCTTVEVNGEIYPIVCGAPNVKEGLKVPVALVGAKLKEDFTISKTKIRGEVSEGMICSEDELGLTDVRQEGILELPSDAPLNTCVRDYFGINDAILEIDNKAINHRPDLFSHIGIIREIYAISGEKFNYEYSKKDFSKLNDLGIKNEIPEDVSRYIGVEVKNVANIETPEYIKQVLDSAQVVSKGLLIDLSNYSLYLYGQPTHCFDADKIEGNINIRYAKSGEKFVALNDNEYELDENDIVIADDKKILALGGIIGGKNSAVSNETKNIIIESANFNQSVIRKTGKKLGVRTDSLNVFEKDIVNELQINGVSLIVSELEKNLENIEITSYSDIYPNKQKIVEIDYDLNFFNKLIGKKFEEKEVLKILENLGIEKKGNKLIIPFWRKDLNFKADIAEEIARITGYNDIKSTIPEINIGAVIQDDIYKIKNDVRSFLTNIGYFDMYTYSFVNNELMGKCLGDTKNLIAMKNALSEELTHLRGSLIPNLMLSLEKNILHYSDLKLFELEKVFNRENNNCNETYYLSGVETSENEVVYYDIQKNVSTLLKNLGVINFSYDIAKNKPDFCHPSRTASIIVRGNEVGLIGEIHPKVAKNFDVEKRIGFFEIDVKKLEKALYQTVKTKDLSNFQENNFDLNFVVTNDVKGSKLLQVIEKTDTKIINKVELVDIYENKEKLGEKRSYTYKIYIQSMEKTLDDNDKAELIKNIISNVAKIGGELR